MKQTELKGIITPILTPMNADESINTDELRTQIDRLIDGGVHGIFPFGTNGEGYILNEKEKCEVLEAAIDQVKGRVPVYAGSGCISTQDTIRMSKEAEKLGADVLSIITPSFAVASQKELYDHYVEVALSLGISPIPWVIVIGACSNLAIATSFGTAVNMQILPAGYKFSDFVKIGGPLLIILIAVVSICSVAFLF